MTIQQLVFIGDLVSIDHGKYIVKVEVKQDGVTLGTGLAAAETVEKAEDNARKRALEVIKWSKKEFSENIKVSEGKKQVITTSKPKIETIKSSPESKKKVEKPVVIETPPMMEEEETQDLWEEYENVIEENVITSDDISTEENINDFVIENQYSEEENLSEEDNQEENIVIENETENLNLFQSSTVENFSVEPILNLEYSETIDFSEIIDQTSIEMKRLGWTQEQGKKYLLETYGKKSRHLLSDDELIEFLHYLQSVK